MFHVGLRPEGANLIGPNGTFKEFRYIIEGKMFDKSYLKRAIRKYFSLCRWGMYFFLVM